jgi:hypothetical protein
VRKTLAYLSGTSEKENKILITLKPAGSINTCSASVEGGVEARDYTPYAYLIMAQVPTVSRGIFRVAIILRVPFSQYIERQPFETHVL